MKFAKSGSQKYRIFSPPPAATPGFETKCRRGEASLLPCGNPHLAGIPGYFFRRTVIESISMPSNAVVFRIIRFRLPLTGARNSFRTVCHPAPGGSFI